MSICSSILSELPPPPPGKNAWPWTEESPQLPDTMPDGVPWPRISVVTPSYNQGRFIEETIRSVLLQGYPNLEYIIMDGGSTDNSVEVIRKYEPWLAYWVSERDRGQSHAINKGWCRSTGEITAYLNSDDILQPNALHLVAELFKNHPDKSVVYGDCDLVDGNTRLLRRLQSQPYNHAQLMLADYIHQSSAFVLRSALEKIGFLDESLHMSMDYDCWVRLALAGHEMLYVSVALSSARLVVGTKTQAQGIKFLPDAIRILNRVYTSPDVPDDIKKVRKSAYGNVWRLGGIRYFDVGMRRESIVAMLRSLRSDPFAGWKPMILSLLIILQSLVSVHWWSPHTIDKG